MQNTHLRVLSVAILLALSAPLAACSSGSSDTSNTVPADNNFSVSDGVDPNFDTPAPPAGVNVYPAVGAKNGVTRHGISVSIDPDKGLTYTCHIGLKSVTVPFDQTVDYNGTDITSNSFSYTSGGVDDQDSLTITFSGNTKAFRAVSMIVPRIESIGTTQTPDYINVDDKVVNLIPAWFNTTGITLNKIDFQPGDYIGNVTLCIKP